MMLRNRNTNVTNNGISIPTKPTKSPTKRAASKQLQGDENEIKVVTGEPLPKRAVLSELRSNLDSLNVDSAKKVRDDPKRIVRRTNSSSEICKVIDESDELPVLDDSVIIVDSGDVETPSAVDPCPNYDFDAENIGDQFNVPEYAMDIFRYYKSREKLFEVGDYMTSYPMVDRDARALLVDWMIELQETFELNHETLYLAVKTVDRFLDRSRNMGVERHQLKVVACAAIFIAAKFDERQPPLVDDFLYVAEDEFTRGQLEQMEKDILNRIGFDLGTPLSYRFVRRYAKASKSPMVTLTLSRYILETSLMFYEFCRCSESTVASGAFLLAMRMHDPNAEWSPVLHKYSGYSAEEVEPWCWALNHMLHVRTAGRGVNSRLNTAFQKYSHEVFFKAACVPLLRDTVPLHCPISAP